MSKSTLSCALAVFIVLASIPASANSNDRVHNQAEKIRAGINKLGVGRETRVRLTLKNEERLAGFISEAGSDSFVITSLSSGESKTVAYVDVTQVKGNNLSTKAKIAIWVGVGVGVTLLLWLIKTQVDDCC